MPSSSSCDQWTVANRKKWIDVLELLASMYQKPEERRDSRGEVLIRSSCHRRHLQPFRYMVYGGRVSYRTPYEDDDDDEDDEDDEDDDDDEDQDEAEGEGGGG